MINATEILWTVGSIVSIISFLIQIWMIMKMRHISNEVNEVKHTVDEIHEEIQEHITEGENTNENRK